MVINILQSELDNFVYRGMKSIDRKVTTLKERLKGLSALAKKIPNKNRRFGLFYKMRRVQICILVLMATLSGAAADAQDLIQIPGVISVHTSFGSGAYPLEELVKIAKEKGIEVLIPTDHDLVAMEYGIFPLRNIIKKRAEKKSVIRMGPEKYLNAIAQINKTQKDVLIIPGVQSSPFYYWTGSPFQGDLTANDYRKELLLIGMLKADDYMNLPLLHRGFSRNFVSTYLPRFIVFILSLLLGIYLSFQRGKYRFCGVAAVLISAIMLFNHHPYQSSRFDPYEGNQGIQPYQDVIDYVDERKGLVFWAHPESRYAEGGIKTGPITLQTRPYPDALLESEDYTGFSGLYGDSTTAETPGRQWDQTLVEYCEGKREKPVWIIAEADFHKKRSQGGAVDFDTYQTIFLAENRRQQSILDALASGKIYALRRDGEGKLSIDRFQVGSKGYKVLANMGEKLNTPSEPEIHIRVSASDKETYPIKLLLIRRGRIYRSLEGKTPFQIKVLDEDTWEGISYYRLAVEGPPGKILSNPIFVSKSNF